MDIGKSIRNIRKTRFLGMNQIEFAVKVGITQTYLSQIESGRKKPSTDILERISEVFGIPLAVMFWLAMEEKDVADNKKAAYKVLKPSMDAMVRELF